MLGLLSTLAFVATCLFLVSASLVIGYGLVTRRRRLVTRLICVLLIWIGLYSAGLLLAAWTAPQHVLARGEEHCFDEMCFSVRDVIARPTLDRSPQPLHAQGLYYLITLQLRNAGRGRAQRPDHPTLHVVDQQGRTYSIALEVKGAAGQPFDLAQLASQPLPPGESVTHTIAFDLPADVAEPQLIITEGGWPTHFIIGDENSPFHPQTALRLTPLNNAAP